MEYTVTFPSPYPNGSSSIDVERHRVTWIALQNSLEQTGYKHRVKLLLLFLEWVAHWSLLQIDECQMGVAGWGEIDADYDGLNQWRKKPTTTLLAYFLVTTPTSSSIIAAINVLLYKCFSMLDPYNGHKMGGPGKRPWAPCKKLNKGRGQRCYDCLTG